MKYDDLALRLAQLDAEIKSKHTLGANAVRKRKNAEKRLQQAKTDVAEAEAETIELAKTVANLKLRKQQIIAVLNNRAQQVQ